ncbi:Transcriptional regulator, TetR family [Caballeronia sordidicola]|jgi:AcrR family transcriptional regulator|uniref:Transcriptional regulator, TetR family n=3 Tax=Caballeronia TaxID=1827195 RepID=A0A242MS29_CABSO|nr:Transcriptional regulator, TetR family [Caballeronia sordidicola]OTP74840.1 Transcriptional regulator, TetR family [Caballeronia sordidicola]
MTVVRASTRNTIADKKPVRRHMDGATAQEQLLDAAERLFYRDGIRAISVDAVVERAGVNKMSVYRQFSSKDDLVVAYLTRMDERFRERVEASFAKHPGDAAKGLVQGITDLVERASRPDYRGCPFVNVACEFADREHPARVSVARNKAYLIGRLLALSEASGAADPQSLADSLALLIEGIYASSQTFGPGCGPMRSAPRTAQTLVRAACAEGRVEQ